MRSLLRPLSFLLWSTFGFCQVALAEQAPVKGMPPLRNFTPAEYQQRGKIWSIDSAPNGIAYMATDGGVVEYDGQNWRAFKGSEGFTRSIVVANDSMFYTGSDLDFGFWERNKQFGFTYTSLYPYKEVAQEVSEEFWQVHLLDSTVVFASSLNLYVLQDQQLVKISAPTRFTGSYKTGSTIYFADETKGLFRFNGFGLELAFSYPNGQALQVQGVYETPEGLLLATRDHGLYRSADGRLAPLGSPLSRLLAEAQVFTSEQLDNGQIAFGTILQGVLISNEKGEVAHRINRYKGLPGNTVLALHYSPLGKLWIGLDYGLSVLSLRQSYTTFYDYRGDFGTGSAAALQNGYFYLGTNQGLYRSAWAGLDNSQPFFDFQLVPGTTGQVWAIQKVGEEVLMGHDRGLFIVQGDEAEQISEEAGIWTILEFRELLLTGSYNGVGVYRKQGGQWQFWKKIPLLSGSCNQLVLEDERTLWANIPNFGLVRVVLDEELSPVDRLIIPESDFKGDSPDLQRIDSAIVLATTAAYYRFDPSQGTFLQTADKGPGADKGLGQLSTASRPSKLEEGYVFHPMYNGFALEQANGEPKSGQAPLPVIFREAEAYNNDERRPLLDKGGMPYVLNNFRAEFIMPNTDGAMYQYRLGRKGAWSNWSAATSAELLDLSPGTYRFFVRGQKDGQLTPAASMAFRVSPPWYRTGLAYAGYVLLFALLAYGVAFWRKRSLQKQEKALRQQERESLQKQADLHEQELLRLEQERLQKEYDELKKQLRTKTIELAKKARENEEKERLLLALKDGYEAAQENPALAKRKWKDMERLLDSHIKAEDKTFEIQMDELHQAFFKRLKARYPDLSSNDLRMCAFLRAGISSKEIAEIFGIKPSSFYISRSRLRKKLGLATEENLYDFLNGI